MKKWILIITGIILIAIIGIGIKINSDLNEVTEAFKSKHSLSESKIRILTDSISPDQKYKYYEYQFDNGGLGYSRVFWSVIENKQNKTDLEKGLIPTGYKIIGWTQNSELILQKWVPYYETNTTYDLKTKTEFNGIKIKISE